MPRRFLIVGAGSIGRRHLANLRTLAPDAEITVWRHTAQAAGLPLANVVHTAEQALASRPEAAIIATPATTHVPLAALLAGHGVPIFMEKPISNTLAGVENLLSLCSRGNVPLMVGYNLRFYAPLQALHTAIQQGRIGRILSLHAEVGQYLPDWRPSADYRQGVSARSELGGGVVLELSHELDYVRWLAGDVSFVMAQTARLAGLEIDVEDTAEAILRFRSGALGAVHLDMTQRAFRRSCWVAGTEGSLSWDAGTHAVRLYEAKSGVWTDLCPAAPIDRNEMYIAELRDFLECLECGRPPAVTGEDGLRALEIALAIKESARTMRSVELDNAVSGATTV